MTQSLMLSLVLGLSIPAQAQSDTEPSSLEEEQAAMEHEAPPTPEQTAESSLIGDEQAAAELNAPDEEPVTDNLSPVELEDEDYYFLGASYRHLIIPSAIQDLFVESSIDGSNPGVGLEFTWRRNNFNIILDAWWANAQAEGFFRASGDPIANTEHVDIDLWVIFVNASFLWSFPITDWFAIEAGFDLGIGFIQGDLVRTEAYETTPGSGEFEPCVGPGNPNGSFCEPPAPDPCYAQDGGHYGCREPNWLTEGGDVPFVFPWVALPRLALRFKPIHQVQIRVDGGYGLYTFFFGGSVAYGF